MSERLTESDEREAMIELDLVAADNVRLMVLDGGLAELDDPPPARAVVIPFPSAASTTHEVTATLARLVVTLAEHRAYPPEGVTAAIGAADARTGESMRDLANLIDAAASLYMTRRRMEPAAACYYTAAKLRLIAERM